jgi:hypothetical protein
MPHLGKLKKMKVTPVMSNIGKELHLLLLPIAASDIEAILNKQPTSGSEGNTVLWQPDQYYATF